MLTSFFLASDFDSMSLSCPSTLFLRWYQHLRYAKAVLCAHFSADEFDSGVHIAFGIGMILLHQDGTYHFIYDIVGCQLCKFLSLGQIDIHYEAR